MITRFPIPLDQLTEREKAALLSLTNGIPLKQIAKHVEWTTLELSSTYRLLIWYLRYVFFYEQHKSYVKEKLANILVVEKLAHKSEWGRKLVLEMVDFPIRNTGYWARKLGYELQGNASGSVLIALFVAEDRIERYIGANPEDNIIRIWYLLFRAIQFGHMDFNRRFRYKAHLFKGLNEWELVKHEIVRHHDDRSLKAEIRKLLARDMSEEEITKHLQDNYGVEVDKIERFIKEIKRVSLEEAAKEIWEKNKSFAETFKSLLKLGYKVTKSRLVDILTGNNYEKLVKIELLNNDSLHAVREKLQHKYGLIIRDFELYRLNKKMNQDPEVRLVRMIREGVPIENLKKEYKMRFGSPISLTKIHKVVEEYGEI